MEGLDLDNILDDEAMSLFNDIESNESSSSEEDNDNEDKETTEVSSEDLFEDLPEGVGSAERDNEGQEDTHHVEGESTSPNSNFFSSIAETFAEEGILPDLDEETIKGIKTAEDFRKAIDDQIKAEIGERQQRILEALDNNVAPSAIRQYEGMINFLDNISSEQLSVENDKGEELRKRLIYQDYINRGFTEQRATREVEKSINNGTDMEDAEEALKSCKNFYKSAYKSILDKARKDTEDYEKSQKERAEQIKKSILDTKNKVFDLDIDKATRQTIFDNISKPVFRDAKSGVTLTAIQKFEMENHDEFIMKLGTLFTLTDGFKSLDKLVNNKVQKGIKKGFKDLESRINNTSRDSYGNLKYTSGVNDSESYLGKGLKLNI